MKWLVILGALLGVYVYSLLHTTDLVLNQAKHLNASYQFVANNANQIATGKYGNN